MTAQSDLVPRLTLPDGACIPQIGYGTLALQPSREASDANAEITSRVVSQALHAGYRHIDTAQSYGTERGVGRAIAESGIPRDELFITSKLANPNHAPDDVRRSFDQTLTDLGVDQLDLFLIHWPAPTLYDGDYVSTWRALIELVDEGLIRTAGVSNFLPAHLDRLVAETGIAPSVVQVELHPHFANLETVAACQRLGIAVEAHSPLGHSRVLADSAIVSIAADHDRSPAQVTLRWHIQHGHIAIPKSTRPDGMRENLALFDFELSPEEMTSIDALDRGRRLGPDPDTFEGPPLP